MTTLDEISKKLDEILEQLKILNWDEDYWEMVPGIQNDVPIVLQPGEKKDIVRIQDENGFITGFVVTSNSPFLEVTFDVDGEKTKATIVELNQVGLTSFNPRMPWVTKYDDVNNIYEVCYTPLPFKFYHDRVIVTVKNPSTAPITFSYKFWTRQRKRR